MPKPIIERRGAKGRFISRQDKNGFSLGYATQKKTYWLTNFRFTDEASMRRALRNKVLVTYLKANKKK